MNWFSKCAFCSGFKVNKVIHLPINATWKPKSISLDLKVHTYYYVTVVADDMFLFCLVSTAITTKEIKYKKNTQKENIRESKLICFKDNNLKEV